MNTARPLPSPAPSTAQLTARLQAHRTALADALSARLHEDGQRAAAGLPRRSEDTDDDAAAETQRERDVADLARLSAELEQVEAALARAATGELGVCPDCGEPIEAARLTASPAALRCTECQKLAEQRAARARLTGR